jgi:glycosyltransferase involved in cell wall biosynthesis
MSKIKVGIDVGPLKNGHKNRGIGSYVHNLVRSLKKYDSIEIVEGDLFDDFVSVDLIHYPTFDLFQRTLPIQKNKPVVVTIHDVTPLVYPKAYPAGIKGKFNLEIQKYALKNVNAVITDSKASKYDLEKYLNIKKELIYPIHLSAGEEFKRVKDKNKLKDAKNKYSLPDKYAIYIGNVNWNKNILRMAEAAVKASIPLVFVGKSFDNDKPIKHVELENYCEFLEKYKNNKDIIRIGFVPTDDLLSILSLSSVCFFASIYEGFGLPILEAQSCGVPVITSNTSSMPEVAGNGALYVDPFNVDEMANALKIVITDAKVSRDLIQKGSENAKKFNWDKTASETIDVYTSVLKIDQHR